MVQTALVAWSQNEIPFQRNIFNTLYPFHQPSDDKRESENSIEINKSSFHTTESR